MAKLTKNAPLKAYNTFGIDATAAYLFEYTKPDDIKWLITEGPLTRDTQMIILGGGSNQLFTGNFNGVVIHPVNSFIEVIDHTNEHVFVKAGAGTNWDKLVEFAVENNWGGIENLSDIPGNVGAAPVQNIGAYGMEAKDTIYQVNAISFTDGSERAFTNNECNFGYRTSAFKNRYKNRYIIDNVIFKLTKNPKFITHYGSLENELSKLGQINLTNIRKAVISTRDGKLPKPEIIGNAGSFFKNPVVPIYIANKIKEQYPDIVQYPVDNVTTKIGAGWLIEKSGLKGWKNPENTAGVYNKQALVIVNYGNATGNDIIEVANYVKKIVFQKFDITLEPEVIII